MGITFQPAEKERIVRNYRFGDLSATVLINLLESRVAGGADRSARILKKLLTRKYHRNLRYHTTGSKDSTVHYTVFLSNNQNGSNEKGYHLRLDANGIIFQITDNNGNDLGTIPGYVAPGSRENC